MKLYLSVVMTLQTFLDKPVIRQKIDVLLLRRMYHVSLGRSSGFPVNFAPTLRAFQVLAVERQGSAVQSRGLLYHRAPGECKWMFSEVVQHGEDDQRYCRR